MLCRQKLLISMHRSVKAIQEYIYRILAAVITIMKNLIILIHVEVMAFAIICQLLDTSLVN